jgi:hypothetical protein
MTAATANKFTPRYGEHVDPIVMEYDCAAAAHIFEGTMVALNAAGNALPAASGTAVHVVGVAEAEVDNTDGAIGDKRVRVRQGTFRLANDTGTALTKASVGGVCYAMDDATVSGSSDTGARAPAGTVEKVETAGVWVKINPDFRGVDDSTLRTDLASTANGDGASRVGVEDAAALFAAADVEAALLELVKYQRVTLADPGTGQAIPVTRSAQVDLTIGSAGAETNTLAIPSFAGQSLVLNANTVGTGTRAITCAQAINQAGNTIMTFASARDFIMLVAIKVGGALRWTVAANDGVALS